MNLKTHTAYPEVHINEHHVFVVKIFSQSGKLLFEDVGAGKDNQDARSRSRAMVETQMKNYVRKEN